jgi:uncharacterized membrane protein YqhA
MTADSPPPSQAPGGAAPTGSPRPVLMALRALRLITGLGIAALLLASATLLLYGVVETARHIVRLVVPGPEPMTNRDIFLASIKLVDLILLATIMQVVGIGLYSLFIDKDLPVPAWLRTSHVDELKNKLAGIVAVMLGVLFLEQVFYWGSERDLLSLGIGIAAVVLALSYFIRSHPEE